MLFNNIYLATDQFSISILGQSGIYIQYLLNFAGSAVSAGNIDIFSGKEIWMYCKLVIDVLLDTKKTPRKPQYNMAPELPLILRFCEFEDLEFICSSASYEERRAKLNMKASRKSCMRQSAIWLSSTS
ncbi:hypothetical protein BHE74_00015322 [Ensete ventricosum]|nr:hypothetical protein GW17_00024345 [Ensete ventricosum]RWW76576.1 hypothetical protein BHE74_00015322 [Ensete ventricosum]RZR75708.1 hypothetical protein BHM03_00000188 [Ensete ventricosum]